MKKSGGKLLGILLTASIIATTAFPMQGMAVEEIDRVMEQEAQVEEENVIQEKTAESTVLGDIPLERETEDPSAEPPEKETEEPTIEPSEKETEKPSIEVPEETEDSSTMPPGKSDVPSRMSMEDTDDLSIMPFSYDINMPVIESFEFVENGRTLTKNDTLHFHISAYDADRDISEITVEFLKNGGSTKRVEFERSEESENLYTGTYDCSKLLGSYGNYNVTKILLEDETYNYVEWPVKENGKYLYTFTFKNTVDIKASDYQIQRNSSATDGKLRVGDTVTYSAHVECGEAKYGSAILYLKTVNGVYPQTPEVPMSYDAKTKTMKGTYKIQFNTYPTEWTIDHIRITADKTSEHFYPYQDEPDKDLKFTVVNDDYDADKPVIKSITIDKNGQMVKAGERISVKVKVEEENPEKSMRVRFNSRASSFYCTLNLDDSTMEYSGTINITRDTYPTKWELTYVDLSDTCGNITFLSDFKEDWNTTRPWYYTVDPEGYFSDTKAPIIESITIDKNGQWVYPGETVTLTVKVDEENPYSTAVAYFYPQVTYVSDYHRMTLRYNADTREYTGTIPITSDTYPCEWMLASLTVKDVKNNQANLHSFKPDWQNTCPWYYKVETDETYREDVKNTVFSVYGYIRQADGGYVYGPFVENKTIPVGRRDSLEGLNVCPPQPGEGVNMKFREEGSGLEINADTEMFFGDDPNPSYDFRAIYDKICVNVVLTYISKDKGMTMAIVPQFIDKDTTYGEMLASFVLPEDADQELLTGYQLDDSVDETAQAMDSVYVGVQAEYTNCVVAWNTKYLDGNGNEVSKVVSKTYEKGTTIHDALAALEKPAASAGLEFEKWALPGIGENETLSHEMINLNVTAVYKGKTTAEAAYTYRGEDGKLVSGSRLMALDGEQLSYQAAFEEVKKALKELKHLKGLVLSDWAGIATGTDMPRYKKMNIQAQYANCAVILKYPKDVYEYVVVEKGSRFTLPVENKTYTDITWEGYSQGQTVTITGDKEFIVANARRKGGYSGEISGEKLTVKEIDKIVDAIDQSGNGKTIYVDMGKTTVVPKEILEAIKGKEVNIVLDMGAYSWSISGNEVVAASLKDIDLKVIVDTDGIPPAIVDSLAEGKPTTQITLAHNGEFGFRADLTVNLGAEHSGSTGKLYYYDSSGKLIFMDAGEIGEDGNISLSFSHASEYVVIFERASINSDNETNSDTKGKDSISQSRNEKKNSDSGIRKSPKTGENIIF